MRVLNIEEIYATYFDLIFSYVLRRVNNVEKAEDITSVVFMKVLRSLDSYDPGKASLKTWLYAITGNEVINFYRKNRILLELEKFESVLKSEDVLAEIQAKQDEYDRKKSLAGVMETMDRRLSFEEKDILMAIYFDDLSYRELAEIKGVKEPTLRSKVHRSLKKIQKYVQFEEEKL